MRDRTTPTERAIAGGLERLIARAIRLRAILRRILGDQPDEAARHKIERGMLQLGDNIRRFADALARNHDRRLPGWHRVRALGGGPIAAVSLQAFIDELIAAMADVETLAALITASEVSEVLGLVQNHHELLERLRRRALASSAWGSDK